MLPFFRKIRWRLAQNNQFFKYSRYAFGEIVLVVIGILIALQINNWNEQRKMRNTELFLLQELGTALRTDLWSLNYEYEAHKNALESCEILLRYTEENQIFNDSLDLHFSRVNNYTAFRHKRGPFESLKSVGLETISNRKLISDIVFLYDQLYYNYVEHQNILSQYILNLKQNFYPPYFNKFEVFDSLKYKGKMRPNDFQIIKLNLEYNYHLKSLTEDHVLLMDFNRMTANNVKNILLELDKEIDNSIQAH